MKKFVKYLARITGVEQEIQKDTVAKIAGNMKNDAWWFSSKGHEQAYNVMHLYSDGLKELVGRSPNIGYIRSRVRALGRQQIDGHNTDKILECEK